MNILIAEDQIDILLLTTLVLETAGHRVEGVFDGDSVLIKLNEQGFDLVILDLQLPDCSGDQVLQKIKTKPSWDGLPVVAFTARLIDTEKRMLLSQGFSAVLAKPFQTEDLLNIVKMYEKVAD